MLVWSISVLLSCLTVKQFIESWLCSNVAINLETTLCSSFLGVTRWRCCLTLETAFLNLILHLGLFGLLSLTSPRVTVLRFTLFGLSFTLFTFLKCGLVLEFTTSRDFSWQLTLCDRKLTTLFRFLRDRPLCWSNICALTRVFSPGCLSNVEFWVVLRILLPFYTEQFD